MTMLNIRNEESEWLYFIDLKISYAHNLHIIYILDCVVRNVKRIQLHNIVAHGQETKMA